MKLWTRLVLPLVLPLRVTFKAVPSGRALLGIHLPVAARSAKNYAQPWGFVLFYSLPIAH